MIAPVNFTWGHGFMVYVEPCLFGPVMDGIRYFYPFQINRWIIEAVVYHKKLIRIILFA